MERILEAGVRSEGRGGGVDGANWQPPDRHSLFYLPDAHPPQMSSLELLGSCNRACHRCRCLFYRPGNQAQRGDLGEISTGGKPGFEPPAATLLGLFPRHQVGRRKPACASVAADIP